MVTVNDFLETDLGNVSPNPCGDYDAAAVYEYLDQVYYAGGSYLCVVPIGQTVAGVAPAEGQTTAQWQCVAIPGNIRPDYIAMHDQVAMDAEQTAADRVAVAADRDEVATARADVEQMRQDTAASAREAEASRDSAAGYNQTAHTAMEATVQARQDVEALVTGFDARVEGETQEAVATVETARQTAVSIVNATGEAIIADAREAQSGAETARSGAETARTGAETARTGAETAKAGADNAKAAAKTSETNAGKSASAAKTSETNAKTSETAAAQTQQEVTDYVESQKAAFVGYSRRETDSQYANAIIKTATGAGRVDVADAWTAPVIGLDVAGRSEQVQTTGKNLFGGDALVEKLKAEASATVDGANGTVTFNASAINGKVIYSDFEVGKEYTIILYGRNTKTDVASKYANMQVNYDDGTYYGLVFEVAGENSYCVCHPAQGKNIASLVGQWGTTGTLLYYEKCGIFEGNIDLSAFEPYTGAAASPSPAYPQQIVSTGTVGTGTQLLELNRTPDQVDSNVNSYKYIDGGLTCVFGAKNYAVRFKVPVQPNTIYTISTSDISTGGYLSLSDFLQAEKSGISVIVSKGQNSKTFNSGTATEVTLSIYSANDSYLTVTAKNIMLNSGPTAKPWEPYTGGKPAPSAEYPQEMTVRATNANLFDADAWYDYFWDINHDIFRETVDGKKCLKWRGASGYDGVNKIYLQFPFDTKPNTQYVIEFEGKMSAESAAEGKTCTGIGVKYQDGTTSGVHCPVSAQWKKVQLTTAQGRTVKALFMPYNHANYCWFDIDSIRIYKLGDTPVLHQSAAATITLTEPLRGKGEYQDRLGLRDGVWGIEGRYREIVFDGSEDEGWSKYGTVENKYYVVVNDALYANGVSVMCDRLTGKKSGSANDHTELNAIWLHATSAYPRLHINYQADTLAKLSEKLQEYPLTVIYPLAEPTWTPLPDATQQALNALTTYARTTHLTITTGGTTPDVTLDYVQDTHKALDQCQEAAKTYADTQIANIVAAMPTEVQAAIVDNQITTLLQEV